jgi:hypothetical protein
MRKSDKKANMLKVNLLVENRNALLKESVLDGKFGDKRGIAKAIYKLLEDSSVEGRYKDEYWLGVNKLRAVFVDNGIEIDLVSAKYEHNNSDVVNTQLPNSKVYVFEITVMDKVGREQKLPLRVMCAFVGSTGTMEDKVYELTYYFTM